MRENYFSRIAGCSQVQLVDLAGTDRSPLNINAHDSELVALTLNVQGTPRYSLETGYFLDLKHLCELHR